MNSKSAEIRNLVKTLASEQVKRIERIKAGVIISKFGIDAVPFLLEKIDSDSWISRANVSRILALIGEEAKQAIPILVQKMIKDPNENVRYWCAWALCQIGARDYAKVIRDEMFAEKNENVKFYFVCALTTLEMQVGDGMEVIFNLIEKDKINDTEINVFQNVLHELNIFEKYEKERKRFLELKESLDNQTELDKDELSEKTSEIIKITDKIFQLCL
ncbi:MAG: HEAT repeat domain-containing protein [Candidatus Heimdallarchaeota archaeon]